MKNPLHERPWLLIVAALAGFVLAWTVFLFIAVRHQPESIVVPTREAPAPRE